jgi:hypothetical protein
MTRLNPIFTSLKTLNITYQTPQETLLGTPETLPTSEPATPQIGYTVAQSDLPTFNMSPYQKKWVAILIGAGKAVTAATIYYRQKKNGVSVNTGSSSVSANNYYTCQCFFYDVAVGDVLELALWSNQADSNWDYKAYQIQVSRLILLNKPRLLSPCKFAALTTHPALTLGSPSYTYNVLYPIHCDLRLPSISAATFYESLYLKDTYGMFQIYYGDYSSSNSSMVRTNTTYRPYYYRNYVPTQIIMRGVKTD